MNSSDVNRRRAALLIGMVAALVASPGCDGNSNPVDGGGEGGVGDLTPPVDLTVRDFLPPPPSLPQLQPQSGAILAAVNLVTISFTNVKYPYADAVEGFGDYIVDSSWIATIGRDYGVGRGAHIGKYRFDGTDPLVLPEAHSVTDAQVSKMLRTKIAAGALPKPDGKNTLYMVYFPSSVSVTQPNGSPSCAAYGGFHASSTAKGVPYAFAVIADCGGGLDGITVPASHELAEAITDPYPGTNLESYRLIAGGGDPWVIEEGDESGDMCNLVPYTADNYVVQRIWSNTQAALGKDPCIPGVDTNYFNVSVDPVLPTVAAGKTVVFQITGWASGKADPWTLSVEQAVHSSFAVSAMQPQFTSDTVYQGHTTTLRLTVPANAVTGDVGGVLVASGPQPYYYSRRSVWPVAFIVE